MTSHYIFLPDQPLLRLPRSVLDQLSEHKAAILDCADQKVSVAKVRTIDEFGVPREVHEIIGWYLEFDEKGMLPQYIKQQWINDAFARFEGHKLLKGEVLKNERSWIWRAVPKARNVLFGRLTGDALGKGVAGKGGLGPSERDEKCPVVDELAEAE